MKRRFAMLTALTLLLSLTACGQTGAQNGPGQSQTQQEGTSSVGVPSSPGQSAPPAASTPEDSGSGEETTERGVLVAYFSWGGNTRGIAEEIQAQTGADLFEIQPVEPYSTDYNTVLEQAQQDQSAQARPELSTHVENMAQYDTILLGYPNWWASIPMPVASFLEEYDFTGKTIVPFCSHGGGRFGQSLTAITKLVPEAVLGEGLAISYSGGSGMPDDVAAWLEQNQIPVV